MMKITVDFIYVNFCFVQKFDIIITTIIVIVMMMMMMMMDGW